MNVLLVSGPGISLKEPYNSGIEAFIVSFANQLSEEGHTVDVLADEAESNAKFKLLSPFTGSFKKQSDFLQKLKEKRQFKEMGIDSYDVIHYNMFYPHLFSAGLSSKKTSFLTLHSPVDRNRIAVFKKLSRKSHLKFVAISERVKKQYESALDIDMPLIHNGIDVTNWPSEKFRKQEYLLWSGRLTKEKNVAAAIKIAQKMKIPLKIAGRIVDQKYYDEKVKPHLNSTIEYVGHVTQRELNILAQNAYAFLATATWQEPFGLAALEMLASGLPVVAFNTAVPQDWKHVSVLTTESANWEDLIDLVEKSKTISSEECKDFASSKNIQKMTADYLDLYKEVLTADDKRESAHFKDDQKFINIDPNFLN